jgi:hypothetical protein
MVEVLTRLGGSADRELVREAVEDALGKRRPRW